MKSGDWIRINFIGKIKLTGEVFDLTGEEDAKAHDVYDKDKKYGPALVIIDGGMIIPGVERELLKMKPGEKRSFEVVPKDALGDRKPELIKVLSISKFTEKNMTPFPGMWINVDGRNCKVQAVSGGRVRVDFNHPLAGKVLVYEIEIVEEIKDAKKRVEALIDYYGITGKVTIVNKTAKIEPEKDANPFTQKLIEETLKKWCPGIDSVKFAKKGKSEKKPAEKEAEAKEKSPLSES